MGHGPALLGATGWPTLAWKCPALESSRRGVPGTGLVKPGPEALRV
ncbi:hypothetical protein DVDV_1616 [Desulfovibrio sp. DV]|nr:hypothetical protein DVDV_1616 [Desulfovibrio sp. DV]